MPRAPSLEEEGMPRSYAVQFRAMVIEQVRAGRKARSRRQRVRLSLRRFRVDDRGDGRWLESVEERSNGGS